jgi:small-conductance mechanosensitive channel
MNGRIALLVWLVMLAGFPVRLAAEVAPAAPLRVIIELPNDEAGRAFLKNQLGPSLPAVAPPAAPPSEPAAQPVGDGGMTSMTASELDLVRSRAMKLGAAAPFVEQDIEAAAGRLDLFKSWTDVAWLIVASALFVGGGFAMQRVARWSARGLLNRILNAPGETVLERLRLFAMRLAFGLLLTAAFLLGSLGAFLLFPWPPVFREIVLALLAATLAMRLAVLVGRVFIAPDARHVYFRVLPMDRPLAWFWYRWLLRLVRIAAIGAAVSSVLDIIGVPEASRDVVQAAWLGLLAVGIIIMVWQRERLGNHRPLGRLAALLFTVATLLAWGLFVTHLFEAFWALVVIATVPMLIVIVKDAVRNVTRYDDPDADTRVVGWAVVVDRTLRGLLVFGGILVVTRAWRIDLGEIAMGETAFTHVLRAALRLLVIGLATDVAWRLVRAITETQPIHVEPGGHSEFVEGVEARRRQRLNTLLPILRNFLLGLVAVVAALMILDAIGLQIGPLLAGAGVVGIAVGFGAQTLVKDIISGVFYLVDDAFRVGEYIQTARHKGTVESFSLRSVKLRHHRGPLTTVPFGELGAVQNLSRDWVIDKITVGVTYNTDLDRVKKIVKEIGRELAADEEVGPSIMEPLKMQGVEAMGDFAIQIRLKMMTKPGEQFVARRRAYSMLKKAFAANGIEFASPFVRVAGEGLASQGAAARLTLDAAKEPVAAAAELA